MKNPTKNAIFQKKKYFLILGPFWKKKTICTGNKFYCTQKQLSKENDFKKNSNCLLRLVGAEDGVPLGGEEWGAWLGVPVGISVGPSVGIPEG